MMGVRLPLPAPECPKIQIINTNMQLTIKIPDQIIEKVKDKLPPPESGVLEAVALDAILGFLQKLEENK
jgi:hypothetical protein